MANFKIFGFFAGVMLLCSVSVTADTRTEPFVGFSPTAYVITAPPIYEVLCDVTIAKEELQYDHMLPVMSDGGSVEGNYEPFTAILNECPTNGAPRGPTEFSYRSGAPDYTTYNILKFTWCR